MARFDTLEGVINMFPHPISSTKKNSFLHLLLFSVLLSSLATTYGITEATQQCKSNEFQCANGYCTANLWRCDEDDDCGDNSDEIGCPEVVIVCSEGQFKCATAGTCIPTSWLCDQELDCDDGSDEQECSESERVIPSFRCSNGTAIDGKHRCDAIPQCQGGEDEKECLDCPGFLCSNNRCIETSQYCDGVNDCRNGDDEPTTCHPNCAVDNGGCDDICLQRGETVVCDCSDGYELFNNAKCRDVNECESDINVCPGYPMTCVNEYGTYSCLCPQGFIFVEEQRSCFANESVSPPVIFSTRESVMYLAKVNSNYTMNLTPGKSFRGIIAIDFDPREGTIFFSEKDQQRILKYFLTSREEEVIADEGVRLVDGIAYDWIYENMYFTESELKKVEVISLKTLFRKILFETELDEPRGIAVDPMEGHLYFTDWGFHPKIEKAAMDGSSRQIIIDENLYWPNGLCIEYSLRRLFWVNAGPPPSFEGSYIASSDLDGGRIQILVEGSSRVQLPFAISVFQDNIYWTDWGMESLMTANSFTGAGWSVVLRNIASPMDIKVFNRKAKYNSDEEVLNLCPTNRNACSHMCLAAPNNNHYSCACPNNAFLAEDMKTCLCNSTAKLNEDGVTCGGINMDNVTPANEVTGSVRTPLPADGPIKFNLTMKCRITDFSLKCRVRNSQDLLIFPDSVPEELSCRFSKDTGELVCKY